MDNKAEQDTKVDVAINIFAKPWQTALSLLSLLDKSGSHIGKIWMQYEPVGSRYDKLPPYVLVDYLREKNVECVTSQPDIWLSCDVVTEESLKDPKILAAVRYQHAFENTGSPYLFLLHNDVYIFADLIGALKENIGTAFAIGQLGQCWNCPAANEKLMRQVLGRSACRPESYANFRPDHRQLLQLYQEARKNNIFVRPYDAGNFEGEFQTRPWPLPECRINEWGCLINMELARKHAMPLGPCWPPGAFRQCGDMGLDTMTAFFRDMHARGFEARHFDLRKYLKHWVGTGNHSQSRYVLDEDRARDILRKNYPEYLNWLETRGINYT